MYKLVIFDLDDTLINTWSAFFPHSLRNSLDAMKGNGLEVSSYDEAYERLAKINEAATNTDEAMRTFLDEVDGDLEKHAEVGREEVIEYDFGTDINLMPSTQDVLDELYSRGIDLVMVTKGDEIVQRNKIKHSGLDETKFGDMYFVTDYDKREPYKRILDKYGHSPHEVLVVGDRYKTDLIPAREIGMKTVWIPHGRGRVSVPKESEVDYSFKDLSEILGIV